MHELTVSAESIHRHLTPYPALEVLYQFHLYEELRRHYSTRLKTGQLPHIHKSEFLVEWIVAKAAFWQPLLQWTLSALKTVPLVLRNAPCPCDHADVFP